MENPPFDESPSARMTWLHQQLSNFEEENQTKAKLRISEHLLDMSSSSSDEEKETFLEFMKKAKQA